MPSHSSAMGICAVQSKPHVAIRTLPRPILIRMDLSSVIGKSKDHQQIRPGLEQIEWRDEVEKKDIAPSSITFGNAATKPTNKAFVPSYAETIVLDENGYKLCYNVIVFSLIAVQLFECMSAAYSHAFEDPTSSVDSPYQNSAADIIDVDKQVSSCAGYDTHVYGGYKRQNTGGGGGGSEPKKQRSDNQGGGNNYNNAPPGDNGVGSGSGGHGGHDGSSGGSDENYNTNPENASTEKRFACPFHKSDPILHAACEPLKLTSWDRVLQHILRAHVLQQHYCPICRTQFKGKKAESERNAHHIQNQCQQASMMETGFIFLEIVPEKLQFETDYEHLKGLPRGSDEEKWFEAWKKLFPGRPLPLSPLFESIVDVLRRRAHWVLARMPQPHRGRVVDAIFDLPTVASQRPSAPPAPTPAALASNSAAMTPNMAPLAPPGPIATPARARAPAPPSASASISPRRPPQVPPDMTASSIAGQAINNPTVRRLPAQARMNNMSGLPYGSNPTANPQVGLNASVGYGSNPTTGRPTETSALPDLPGQVLMDSSFGLYQQSPVGQIPIGQQNFQGLDTQGMFGDSGSIWNLGNENIFANPQTGTSPGFDENENEDEDEDELNHPSGLGNGSGSSHYGPGSGFGFNYPDPGSGYMG